MNTVLKRFAIPGSLLFAVAGTGMGAETLTLHGVIRDFGPDHPDFGIEAAEVPVQVAGTVAKSLDFEGEPVYTGEGMVVNGGARDLSGNSVPPHLTRKYVPEPLTEFEIIDGSVVPLEDFAANIRVLGSAITSGGSDVPVTTRILADADAFEPFGSYLDSNAGDVNDGANPRSFAMPGIFPAGTAISVSGRSWIGGGVHIEAVSSSNSPQVRVLRHGDPVPNLEGHDGQTSVEGYVSSFVDTTTNTISLEANEAIFLFEIGTTSLGSSAADFQDLVVLVSLTTDVVVEEDRSVLAEQKTPCAIVDDTPAEFSQPSDGAIDSVDSFEQWFRHWPGVNVSAAHDLVLTLNDEGVYEYSTADFTPIDNRMFGNNGGDHNRGFTLEFAATFIGEPCSGKFLEFAGTADVWVFINGELVFDMGGMERGGSQRLDFDRLNIIEGEVYDLRFFYAQRIEDDEAPFELRTNLWMSTPPPVNMPMVSTYD